MDLARRQFMFVALGALLRADDRPKRDLVTLSARPEDLEMPLSGFADYITPIDRFFCTDSTSLCRRSIWARGGSGWMVKLPHR